MLRTTNVDDDVFAIAGGFGLGIEKRRAVGGFESKYSIVYYRVPYLLSGISGYLGNFGYTKIVGYDLKYQVIPNISWLFQN